MYDIKVSLDNVSYTSTPAGSEVGQISQRIGESSEVIRCPTGMEDFVRDVSIKGYTFSPATLDGMLGSLRSASYSLMRLYARCISVLWTPLKESVTI